MTRYEVYRQDVFLEEGDPEEDGWVPFAATCTVCYGRESLGGNYVDDEVIWWRREVPEEDGDEELPL
jgi:hypothetical protein